MYWSLFYKSEKIETNIQTHQYSKYTEKKSHEKATDDLEC
jgi:hypothetical protein